MGHEAGLLVPESPVFTERCTPPAVHTCICVCVRGCRLQLATREPELASSGGATFRNIICLCILCLHPPCSPCAPALLAERRAGQQAAECKRSKRGNMLSACSAGTFEWQHVRIYCRLRHKGYARMRCWLLCERCCETALRSDGPALLAGRS
jgi:hypothetical protein